MGTLKYMIVLWVFEETDWFLTENAVEEVLKKLKLKRTGGIARLETE